MTSKELLEHIKNAPSFKGGDTRYTTVSNSATQYDADIKQIEQDLEFFEILKKIAYGVGTEEDYANARKHYERECKQALEESYKGCKKLGDIMDKENNNDK